VAFVFGVHTDHTPTKYLDIFTITLKIYPYGIINNIPLIFPSTLRYDGHMWTKTLIYMDFDLVTRFIELFDTVLD
jgi:hypothetical protein